MSGSGRFSLARSRSGDRFYNPPAIRRYQQQQEHELYQYQLQQNQFHHQNQMLMLMRTKSTNDRTESDDSSSSSSKSSFSPPPTKKSLINSTNLDRFLESVTPSVPTQSFSKSSTKVLKTSDTDCSHPYFNLGDLWEAFKEWSAAGVPLVLNGNDSVVQYYVPYLSGIQRYVDPLSHLPG